LTNVTISMPESAEIFWSANTHSLSPATTPPGESTHMAILLGGVASTSGSGW